MSYAGLAALAFFGADRLIFRPPSESPPSRPRPVFLTTSDGIQVPAIDLPAAGSRYTIIYSHGNADTIWSVQQCLQDLRAMGYSVLAYEYPGYSGTAGRPSEARTYRAADAAYDYVVRARGVTPEHIIAYGVSLGGAVAIDLASRKPVGGLVVESSFTSAARLAHLAFLPFDEFRSIDKIRRVRCPVLIMHGTSDNTIPLSHGKVLFEHANQPKLSLWVDGADHEEVLDFHVALVGKALAQLVQAMESLKNP